MLRNIGSATHRDARAARRVQAALRRQGGSAGAQTDIPYDADTTPTTEPPHGANLHLEPGAIPLFQRIKEERRKKKEEIREVAVGWRRQA